MPIRSCSARRPGGGPVPPASSSGATTTKRIGKPCHDLSSLNSASTRSRPQATSLADSAGSERIRLIASASRGTSFDVGQQRVATVTENLRNRPRTGGDHGPAGHQRLAADPAEGLIDPSRVHHHVAGREDVLHVGRESGETHRFADASPARQRGQARRRSGGRAREGGAVRPGRTPHGAIGRRSGASPRSTGPVPSRERGCRRRDQGTSVPEAVSSPECLSVAGAGSAPIGE